MKYRSIFVILLAGALSARGEGQITSPAGSLVSRDRPAGWNVGVAAQLDRRAFDSRLGTLDLDMTHWSAIVGYDLTSFLNVSVLLGSVEASRGGYDGKTGFEWGVNLHASWFEYVIDRSDVTGKKQYVRLDTEVAFSKLESDFADGDLDWWELTAIPSVSYTLRRSTRTVWDAYDPVSAAIRGGLAFTTVDGTFQGDGVNEAHPFGFTAGTDMLFASGWVAGVNGIFYSGSDREVRFELSYKF